MSDDWTNKYIRMDEEKRQEKQVAREMADLARAVAPDVFQRIKNRVQHDVQTLHAAGVVQSLNFKDISTQSFAVNDMGPAAVSHRSSLVVELDFIVVKYCHYFPQKGETSGCESPGALRIHAEINGVPRLYRNGSFEEPMDDSEVSELLLGPLLKYIISQ
jgi:hypothetical protein